MLITWLINISDDIEEEKWKNSLKYIENDRRQKINKFKFIEDKKRSLIAGLLVKTMLNELSLCDVSKTKFSKGCYGKPYIKNKRNLHFNISHSGDYVCCAISDNEVGIDIERINTSMDIDVFQNYFTNCEWKQLSGDSRNKYEKFFSLWTLKESYIKRSGKGLNKDLSSFSISLSEPIQVLDDEIEKESSYFTLHNVNSLYKLAICTSESVDTTISEMSVKEFLYKYY
ncbi:4'-phosphopantetheinyl transferase family protein [Staphylococcus aureus]|uniref:4'-phosphopantetheinyl transferase family protein n=1 Tax=Staphylococcus aureus TaxID=1280 RepID=UPI001780784E|nr:4'-phosphopantetheinyl transferase superfamily protein [Staphylococcus aureus]